MAHAFQGEVLYVRSLRETDSIHRVLRDGEGQHSLWPAAVGVLPGWQVAPDAVSRQDCLAFLEENWTDMRPHSLRLATAPLV
ncbi:MbtH family NRPS accessory protein [Streptomyces sp. NPDC006872]|uniref:MbtH family protein n=1 Tax=Streptomyces sp. NPDC006872 TaxID=3155720 RepID=UPI0033D69382